MIFRPFPNEIVKTIQPAHLWWKSCQAHQRGRPRLAKAYKWTNFLLFKCLLPFEARIERDLILEHYALGVVVHPNVTIGRGVRIFHHVTLATQTWIGSPHRIVVGDGVMIGTGAIVIGRGDQSLHIGDGAIIGAGAVVTGDVAAGLTVVGAPARPIASSSRRPAMESHVNGHAPMTLFNGKS